MISLATMSSVCQWFVGVHASRSRALAIFALALGVTSLSVHAAPPPPRGGGEPYSPPEQPAAVAPAAPFTATPLTQLIAQHEKDQTLRMADVKKLNITNMTRVLREDYLAHGSRNEKWDDGLLKAIDETIRCLEIDASVPQRKALIHMLRLPARFKCDDPRYWYMFVYARHYEASQENLTALEKGIELARANAEHNRYLIWLMELRLSQMQDRWKSKQALAIASRQRAREAFVQWLEHDLPAFDANLIYDWCIYFEELADPVTPSPEEEASINQMMQAIGRLAHITPWMQSLLQAKAAMQWAWGVRGHAYAHKVPQEAWKVWGEKNLQAYELATRAHELNPQQALASAELIRICWSMDEDRGRQFSSRYWFEQSIAAMIDWQEAYDIYLTGILPRWHGSLQMELDFAWECAQTKRYDTNIPFLALSALSNITWDAKPDDAPLNPQLARQIFVVLNHVMSGYLEHEKDPDTRQVMQQFWFNWAWHLDMPDQALRIAGLLDRPYDPRLPFNKKYSLNNRSAYSYNLLLARGQPGGELISQAIHAERYEKNWPAAKRMFEKVIVDNQAAPAGIQFARDRIQLHAWQEALDQGQWVSLQFDEHLSGWKQLSGKWERIDENTIQGTNDDLPMRLLPIIDTGANYQWEMTIHFIHKTKGPALMAGIVYAYENHPEHYDQYGQFVRQEPGSLWCHLGGYEPYRIGNHELPEKMTCTFILQNGRMKTLIDGQELFKDSWMRRNASFLAMAMGTANSKNPGSIIQYSNIRVRKLPDAQQANEED